MIIETISIRNIGPFQGAVSVGPLDKGLNILAANNEAGKTTVVKSVVRALFDRHTCRSEEIKLLQPVGTSLAPNAVIVFQMNGDKYQIDKTFIDSPRSLLSRLTGTTWKLLEEGDKADERLQILLNSTQPGRGATKPEHWGLFQYLWAKQGEAIAWPQWNGEAGKLVRSHLVKIEIDPLIESLKDSFWKEYTEIFTDQGRPKIRGSLASSGEKLEALQGDLQGIQQKVQDLATLQSRFQTLGEEIANLESERADKIQQANEVSGRAREVEQLRNELTSHEARFHAAQNRLHTVQNDQQDLDKTQRACEEMTVTSAQLWARLQEFDASEGQIVHDQQAATGEFNNEEARHSQLQARAERLSAILKCRRLQNELDRLQDQAGGARSQEAEVKRLSEAKSRIPLLTPQRLNKLQDLDLDLVRLNAEIRSIGIAAELTPDLPAIVEINESGANRRLEIKQTQTERISAGQSLTMQLQGWGRIHLRSGATELKNLEEEIEHKRLDLSTALAELGIKSVVAAASLLQRRKDLDGQIREAQHGLTHALGEFETVDKLNANINQRTAQLNNLRRGLHLKPADEVLSVSELEAQEETLKYELKTCDSNIREVNKSVNALHDALSRCRDDRHKVNTELATLEERQRNATSQIADLSARYPDGLDSALRKAQDEFFDDKAVLESAQRKLPADADRLPERNRRAAAAVAQVEGDLEQRRGQWNKDHGALEARGSEGLYSQESDLLERIEVEQERVRTARYRGWAARLLHDLLEFRKQAATQAVLRPLQDRLSSTFADLTGVSSRRIFLDEDLQIRGVGQSEENLLPFDLLSQGAKEQLILSLRLGVALTLSEKEPQSIILDDVLVNTDPIRQDRVLDFLQSAAANLQILILTCHADRYRGIGKTVSIQTHNGDI